LAESNADFVCRQSIFLQNGLNGLEGLRVKKIGKRGSIPVSMEGTVMMKVPKSFSVRGPYLFVRTPHYDSVGKPFSTLCLSREKSSKTGPKSAFWEPLIPEGSPAMACSALIFPQQDFHR
jgi:hypothetical protein